MIKNKKKKNPEIVLEEIDHMMEEHKNHHEEDHLSNFSFASGDSEDYNETRKT
jgi:hypothetical protein